MSEKGGPEFGFDDDELAALPTVFRPDLLAGKVALVSGATGGLGRAISVLFARLGADLVICGRDEAKLDAFTGRLQDLGAQVLSRAMTIRDPDAVDALMAASWDRFGRLDTLINNAGGQFPQAAIDFSIKGWHAVVDTNLNGTWYMMQNAARRWIAADDDRADPGNIINIVAAIWRGMPGFAHSCAARAGVVYLSRSVAVEWAPENIRVNCVAPGCVETSAFPQYEPEGRRTFAQANPMLRLGDAQDVAEACVYLAAPSGKFITGDVINIDGGQQLWGDPWPTGRPDYFRLTD